MQLESPRATGKLKVGKKLLLAIPAAAAVVVPVVIGALDAPSSHAQEQSSPRLQFEAASIKPTKLLELRQACHGIDSKFGRNDTRALVPLGRCVVAAGRLSHMIGFAYGVRWTWLKGVRTG